MVTAKGYGFGLCQILSVCKCAGYVMCLWFRDLT